MDYWSMSASGSTISRLSHRMRENKMCSQRPFKNYFKNIKVFWKWKLYLWDVESIYSHLPHLFTFINGLIYFFHLETWRFIYLKSVSLYSDETSSTKSHKVCFELAGSLKIQQRKTLETSPFRKEDFILWKIPSVCKILPLNPTWVL